MVLGCWLGLKHEKHHTRMELPLEKRLVEVRLHQKIPSTENSAFPHLPEYPEDISSKDATNFSVHDIGLCAQWNFAEPNHAPSYISFSFTLAWSKLKEAQKREEAKKMTTGAFKWTISNVSCTGFGTLLPTVLFQFQITQCQPWLLYYSKYTIKEKKPKNCNNHIKKASCAEY